MIYKVEVSLHYASSTNIQLHDLRQVPAIHMRYEREQNHNNRQLIESCLPFYQLIRQPAENAAITSPKV